jgi:hypothetical protein
VGYFTGYSAALARVALRKTRYLEGNPDGEASAPPQSISNDNIHNGDIHNGNSHSVTTASNSNTPVHSGDAPAASPNSKPAPVAQSPFGAKLQQALDDERK